MIYNKTRMAAVDITQMPNIFFQIKKDIENIEFDKFDQFIQLQKDVKDGTKSRHVRQYRNFKKTHGFVGEGFDRYGNVYFAKKYNLTLDGWSGLNNFYTNLEKVKELSNSDIAVIKRVVLDPTLCIRLLTKNEAKDFWKKDFHQGKKPGRAFNITVVVCDEVIDAKGELHDGFYSQNTRYIYLKRSLYHEIVKGENGEKLIKQKTDIKKIVNTFYHEFAHVLDHITAITLQQNCNTLKSVAPFAPVNRSLFKTPNDQNKNIDLHDIDNPSKQEYIASFAEIVVELKNTIISDMMFYHRQFYVQDLSNVIFCYVTNYNVLTKKTIDRNAILNKLKELQEETNMLYYDLFEYVLTHNSSYLINKFNNIGRASKTDYNGIVQDMYNQLKHDRYISTPNEVQKKILSAI